MSTTMTRVGLLAFVLVLSGFMSGCHVSGHVWNRADNEPTYTEAEPDRTRGHSEDDADIASGWTKPSEGLAPSLEEPDGLHYRPPSGVHPHRQGPITDPYVITTFAEKLHRSLERSTQFSSRQDYHTCLTGSGIKGFCTPIRLCLLHVFLESLEVFLKYTCAIDNDHIGVCCPAEFVTKPSASNPRPDITTIIVTPGVSQPVGGSNVVNPSAHRPDGSTTLHIVVVTGHSKPTSRPVYPVSHEDPGSSGNSRPTASRPVYPVQHEEHGHPGNSRPVHPVPHEEPGPSGNSRPTASRPVYPVQHGDAGTSGTLRPTASRPLYPVQHEERGPSGNSRPTASRPVQHGDPGSSGNSRPTASRPVYPVQHGDPGTSGTSRPLYPVPHEEPKPSGNSRPTASRPVYPVQHGDPGTSGTSRPVYPVPHEEPKPSGNSRPTASRPVYPVQHGDPGTSGNSRPTTSRPVYPVQHEQPGNSGNSRPAGSRPVHPVHQGEPGPSKNRDGQVSVNRHVGPARNSSKPSSSKPGSSKPSSKPQGSNAILQNTTTTRRPTTSRPGLESHAHMKRTPPRPEPPELQELRSTCGIPILHKRIVGGQEANPNQWAWMASLMRSETGEHYCGGALISNRYIITAAHCTVGLKAINITVRLGAYNIQEPSEHVRDVEVSRIRQHPQFQKDTFMNDIAVLRLKRAVSFNQYVRPVCLPQRSNESFFGKTAVATGWGTLSFGGPYSDVLREVKLIVWNNTQCRDSFAQPITDVFLCAGPKKREGDACQGDSGGPLMVQARSKQWTLVGVISWGIKCGEPGIPGIYTRVTQFIDYIYEHAINQ